MTTIYAQVDLSDVHRMHTALGKLLSTVRRRIPTAWTPTRRSDADRLGPACSHSHGERRRQRLR